MLRIVEEMRQTVFLAGLIKMFLKLAAVVSLDSGSHERGDLNELPQNYANPLQGD